MDNVTLDDLVVRNLVDESVVAFLSTLVEMANHFSVDGERILRDNIGYRNRKWVEALFEVAANKGYFRQPDMCVEDALPYSVIQPLITNELVAVFCLADNLLKSLYYEYKAYAYQQQFLAALEISHAAQSEFKELRMARYAFRRQKISYLRIACCGRVPRKYRKLYDVENCMQEFVGKIDLGAIFSIMSPISELYPRDTANDASPLSKLCRKYAPLFAFCDEVLTSLSV